MICQIVHANDDKRRLGEEILCIGKKRFFLPIFFNVLQSIYERNKAPRIVPLGCCYAKVTIKRETVVH